MCFLHRTCLACVSRLALWLGFAQEREELVAWICSSQQPQYCDASESLGGVAFLSLLLFFFPFALSSGPVARLIPRSRQGASMSSCLLPTTGTGECQNLERVISMFGRQHVGLPSRRVAYLSHVLVARTVPGLCLPVFREGLSSVAGLT